MLRRHPAGCSPCKHVNQAAARFWTSPLPPSPDGPVDSIDRYLPKVTYRESGFASAPGPQDLADPDPGAYARTPGRCAQNVPFGRDADARAHRQTATPNTARPSPPVRDHGASAR
jgi:hypothetical protein